VRRGGLGDLGKGKSIKYAGFRTKHAGFKTKRSKTFENIRKHSKSCVKYSKKCEENALFCVFFRAYYIGQPTGAGGLGLIGFVFS